MAGANVTQDVEYKTGEPRAHHRFYIPDGDIDIQVNNALFRVHRYFLAKHSAVMRDTFGLPGSDSSQVKRAKTDNIVCLSDDSVVGWECLLGLFYSDNPCQAMAYKAEEWVAIILLANKYIMDGVEAGALKQLRRAKPPLDKVELVMLAQKVDSKELYQEALQSLAKQDQMLSFEDAQKIGIKAFYDVTKQRSTPSLVRNIFPLSLLSASEDDIDSVPGPKRKRTSTKHR